MTFPTATHLMAWMPNGIGIGVAEHHAEEPILKYSTDLRRPVHTESPQVCRFVPDVMIVTINRLN